MYATNFQQMQWHKFYFEVSVLEENICRLINLSSHISHLRFISFLMELWIGLVFFLVPFLYCNDEHLFLMKRDLPYVNGIWCS